MTLSKSKDDIVGFLYKLEFENRKINERLLLSIGYQYNPPKALIIKDLSQCVRLIHLYISHKFTLSLTAYKGKYKGKEIS